MVRIEEDTQDYPEYPDSKLVLNFDFPDLNDSHDGTS